LPALQLLLPLRRFNTPRAVSASISLWTLFPASALRLLTSAFGLLPFCRGE